MKTFWYYDTWQTLFKNCQRVNNVKESVEKKKFLLEFFLKQVVFLLLGGYFLFVWSIQSKTTLLTCFVLSNMTDLYYEFLFVDFVKYVLKVLKSAYENLNKRVLFQENLGLCEELMKSYAQNYRLLGETIDTVNKLFGFQILLIIFHTGLHTVNTVNFDILYIQLESENFYFYYQLVSSILLVLLLWVSILCFVSKNFARF